MKSTLTGDTLCDPAARIVLEAITFPEPVVSVAVEPKSKADQDRIGEAMQKLTEEDPTFQTHYDDETGQTIISGMGELHLEVLLERMRREFRVETKTGQAAGGLQGDNQRVSASRGEIRQAVWRPWAVRSCGD